MTSCQTSDKQPQMKMKIGIMININMTKSNMALVFNIINFSLIIHRKVTCCQTSIKQPQILIIHRKVTSCQTIAKTTYSDKNQHDKVRYDIQCFQYYILH